ncbi:branched-chain amino acid ABC transporter permease [Desulfolutivibrio sulfoxidireducens]|uniref:branched-chain amino acid ABC transporter permease n=1 Tax=Desulfolutivibrio sulfoxidireducens TaxID=2773299 RepID=UPI00159E99B0|nr:branched-chain amino acid ABC transporter permease [Desulfolutivibrio sulfoxidireducens]QLA17799.1 branched-chain amino acid ABC transporter permease [Desulfolutivibrio sulfoxidireducens]QLA21377.1 branched-chain amino acid ABC transporter permease [Desulfolutivibrio sulfoxidireducens]
MKKLLPFLILGALAVLPLVGLNTYIMHIIILAVMWAVAGIAWNLLGGYCGQVSFGHAAFFGVGAYSAGLLTHHFGVSAWWGFLVCVPIVALIGLIMGLIVLRLRGPYFVLATLAIGEVMRITVENLTSLTNGTLGIMITRTWVEKTPYYYIILALAALSFAASKIIISSRWGYYFVAVREDQDAAESLGINTTLYKTIALTVSAVITGLAGAFYTTYMGYIDPQVVFSLGEISILIIMVVMVGGVATQWGPAVGAVIMVLLAEMIRSIPRLGTAYQTLFGILLIVIIIYLPNGLVGDFHKIRRIFRKGAA